MQQWPAMPRWEGFQLSTFSNNHCTHQEIMRAGWIDPKFGFFPHFSSPPSFINKEK